MKWIFLILIFTIITVSSNAQISNTTKFYNVNDKISLKNKKILSLTDFKLNKTNTNQLNLKKNTNITEGELWSVVVTYWPFNPILIYENKNFNFGLTKEISIGFLHHMKFSFEYSYIFRNANNNHLRGSLNYLIPIVTSDFALITSSLGAGYFTDTKKSGLFPQGTIELILSGTDNLAVSFYIKLRHTINVGTFSPGYNKSNISDFSLGISTIFLL